MLVMSNLQQHYMIRKLANKSLMPMIEALGITADTMKSAVYQKALKNAREEVSKGVPLSEPITACGLFPPMVSHMTRIGEETGDLEGMLTMYKMKKKQTLSVKFKGCFFCAGTGSRSGQSICL